MLPLLGFSEYDREGGVFHDPDADRAFTEAAVAAIGDHASVVRLHHMINDPVCADRAVEALLELMHCAKRER
jgi:uncharacterized protein (UPF0261 family)